jgi:hypothetical protein
MLAEVKIIKLDSGELLTQIVSVTCTLLVCLLINAWAAATAHFIGKGWSKEIQDWERWNFAFIKQNNDLPYNVIDGIMQQEIKRARRLSWFSGIILMLVILFIAYFRIMALLITENLSGMALIISVVMTALPIALILGELITGDYIWYTIRWLQMRKSRDHFYNNFLAAKKQCGELDQLAMQYTESAKKRGEPVQVIGDLENCHLRIKHRTQSRDDYMEPFENWRRIGFTFKVRKNQRPLANAKTFGVLPNGAKTGDYHTDSDGKTTLYWSGDFDHLISISIYNREYLGPFQSDAEHYIDVPEEVALSANGHDTEGMVFDN